MRKTVWQDTLYIHVVNNGINSHLTHLTSVLLEIRKLHSTRSLHSLFILKRITELVPIRIFHILNYCYFQETFQTDDLMILVMRKSVIGVSDQVGRKPVCIGADLSLEISGIGTRFYLLQQTITTRISLWVIFAFVAQQLISLQGSNICL